MQALKLLALSGSLREASYNTAAIHALKTLAPSPVEIVIGDISALPLFNPDRENETLPPLAILKKTLHSSRGLIIASPEYAHGISGPLKNALDWLVSGAEFPDKPIMLINTSPRAHHAQDALKEVLTTMSGNLIAPAHIEIPLLGSNLTAPDLVSRQDLANLLRAGLQRFCAAITALDTAGPEQSGSCTQ